MRWALVFFGVPSRFKATPSDQRCADARRRLNDAALRFLVLSMNTRQNVLQFEFYNPNLNDELLNILDNRGEVSHEAVRRHLDGFADRMHEYLASVVDDFQTYRRSAEAVRRGQPLRSQ